MHFDAQGAGAWPLRPIFPFYASKITKWLVWNSKYLNNHPGRDYLGASFASIQKIVPSGSFCRFLLSALL
jgi:hypothetical protein